MHEHVVHRRSTVTKAQQCFERVGYVVVEDGESGMIGARAAGMRCVALVSDVGRTYPADLVVRDLRDVPLDWFLQSR